MTETITLTFCDCAENHVGMEQIGSKLNKGFSKEELKTIKKYFDNKDGCITKLYSLHNLLSEDIICDKAYLLVIKNGLHYLNINKNDLLQEQQNLVWDKKALMRGRVVNKIARHNLCFSNYSQDENYEEGKGRVYNYEDLPLLNKLMNKLKDVSNIENLQAEGNRYYNVNKTYISYHGDQERRIVIAVRLGENFPFYYQWYHRFNPVGEELKIMLEHGDIYIMSDKAVGTDWKKSSLYTLRHAAGINLPKKKK